MGLVGMSNGGESVRPGDQPPIRRTRLYCGVCMASAHRRAPIKGTHTVTLHQTPVPRAAGRRGAVTSHTSAAACRAAGSRSGRGPANQSQCVRQSGVRIIYILRTISNTYVCAMQAETLPSLSRAASLSTRQVDAPCQGFKWATSHPAPAAGRGWLGDPMARSQSCQRC